jgi:hypothetical protein
MRPFGSQILKGPESKTFLTTKAQTSWTFTPNYYIYSQVCISNMLYLQSNRVGNSVKTVSHPTEAAIYEFLYYKVEGIVDIEMGCACLLKK